MLLFLAHVQNVCFSAEKRIMFDMWKKEPGGMAILTTADLYHDLKATAEQSFAALISSISTEDLHDLSEMSVGIMSGC